MSWAIYLEFRIVNIAFYALYNIDLQMLVQMMAISEFLCERVYFVSGLSWIASRNSGVIVFKKYFLKYSEVLWKILGPLRYLCYTKTGGKRFKTYLELCLNVKFCECYSLKHVFPHIHNRKQHNIYNRKSVSERFRKKCLQKGGLTVNSLEIDFFKFW